MQCRANRCPSESLSQQEETRFCMPVVRQNLFSLGSTLVIIGFHDSTNLTAAGLTPPLENQVLRILRNFIPTHPCLFRETPVFQTRSFFFTHCAPLKTLQDSLHLPVHNRKPSKRSQRTGKRKGMQEVRIHLRVECINNCGAIT